MKEVRVVAWDDVHKRAGENVEADHVDVELVLSRQKVTLDLSEEHWRKLKEFLEPFLAAGTRTTETGPARTAGTGGHHVPAKVAQRSLADRREFLRGLREWADMTGRSYRTDSGGYYYSVALIEDYERFLAAEVQRSSRAS